MGNTIARFLSVQGDHFVRDEADALAIVFGEGYSNIAKREEGLLNGYWKDVEACKVHLKSFRNMLGYMGITVAQTESVLLAMTNDRTATLQLPKLVDLYRECKLLRAFDEKGDTNQQRAHVALESKKVEFILILRKILPMSINDEHIQDILAELECQKNHTSVNIALMEVAGVYQASTEEEPVLIRVEQHKGMQPSGRVHSSPKPEVEHRFGYEEKQETEQHQQPKKTLLWAR